MPLVDLLPAAATGQSYSSALKIALEAHNLENFINAMKLPVFLSEGQYYHRANQSALIVASEGGNTIDAGSGNHIIFGSFGDDHLRFSTGSNIVDLGEGLNTLNYDLFTVKNTINLATGITTRASGDTDKIAGVDILVTGLGGDDVIGSAGADIIYAANFGKNGLVENVWAGAGDDVIYTWHPNNQALSQGPVNVWGQDGNDTIYGNKTTNMLDGGAGDDKLFGHGGNDTHVGGSGNDIMDGGTNTLEGDFDTLDYRGDPNRIVADFRNTVWSPVLQRTVSTITDGWGDTDHVVDFERIMGSMFDDVIHGHQQGFSFPYGVKNRGVDLYGWGGNDTLTGGDGMDWIDGGAGADILTGGAGTDRFRLSKASDGVGDVITDFTKGEDLIVLGKDPGSEWFWPCYYGVFPENRWVRNEGGLATQATTQLIQDTLTGNLYWDQDGTGAAARIQIASFSTNLELTRFDIHVL